MARIPVHGTRISRTYEPQEAKSKKVRPFRYEDLYRISHEQRGLHQELAQSLPESFFSSNLPKRLGDLMKSALGVDFAIWLDSIRFFSRTQIRALIPGATCLLIVGTAPRTEKIIIEIDLYFAYRAIGKLLGTKAPIDVHRPLTEIEQGVFLFLVLKAFGLVASDFQSAEQLSFRVEDIRNDVRGAAEILRTDDWWLTFNFKFYSDTDSGGIRVLVPRSFAQNVVYPRPPEGTTLALRRRNRIRKRLRPFRHMQIDGFIAIGSLELTRRDLAALEPGDIILLERTEVRLEDGVPFGPAILRIGLGQTCAIHGQVGMNDGNYVFTLEDIVVEKVPSSHDPVEGHGEAQNPEEVVAGYEERADGEDGYDEGNDGSDALESYDEDYGLDDENAGDDDEYYEEEGYEEGGGYEEGEYQEGGEEQPSDEEQASEEEQPQEEGGEDQEQDDNLAQAEPLLGDIPMVVVVELGRVQLTADEVIRLRPGQLVEVGRKPNDLLVDLVVNGKLVAKGKLVEIEGALGVELASLVGADEG